MAAIDDIGAVVKTRRGGAKAALRIMQRTQWPDNTVLKFGIQGKAVQCTVGELKAWLGKAN